MDVQTFNKVVENALKDCKAILVDRAKMYAKDGDRLSNFKRAAQIRKDRFLLQIPVDLLQKQLVALLDDIDEHEMLANSGNSKPFKMANINEWTRDIINYMILIRALCDEYNENLIEE